MWGRKPKPSLPPIPEAGGAIWMLPDSADADRIYWPGPGAPLLIGWRQRMYRMNTDETRGEFPTLDAAQKAVDAFVRKVVKS